MSKGRRRTVKSDPETIGALLDKILRSNTQYAQKARQYVLWDRWDEIAGEQIAKHARPLKMQDKTLIVAVKNSSWLQELTMMKPQLILNIRSALNHQLIRDIRFVLER